MLFACLRDGVNGAFCWRNVIGCASRQNFKRASSCWLLSGFDEGGKRVYLSALRNQF